MCNNCLSQSSSCRHGVRCCRLDRTNSTAQAVFKVRDVVSFSTEKVLLPILQSQMIQFGCDVLHEAAAEWLFDRKQTSAHSCWSALGFALRVCKSHQNVHDKITDYHQHRLHHHDPSIVRFGLLLCSPIPLNGNLVVPAVKHHFILLTKRPQCNFPCLSDGGRKSLERFVGIFVMSLTV